MKINNTFNIRNILISSCHKSLSSTIWTMKCVWVLEEILFSGSGTPGYYPPEKLAIKKDQDSLDLKNSQFKLTPKSDIYSLGVVFLEILTGKTVDDSHSVEKAFITLSNDQHFAPLHDMLSKMIHPEKAMRPKTNTILKILIQEKGWDLQLAKEGIKKAQTLLTDDFWKM